MMKLSNLDDEFENLKFSSEIKIPENEIHEIFKHDSLLIKEAIIELKEHRNKEIKVELHNKKYLHLILDTNILHMYYVKNEQEKRKQFSELLEQINLEISKERKQETSLIKQILENGISSKDVESY